MKSVQQSCHEIAEGSVLQRQITKCNEVVQMVFHWGSSVKQGPSQDLTLKTWINKNKLLTSFFSGDVPGDGSADPTLLADAIFYSYGDGVGGPWC